MDKNDAITLITEKENGEKVVKGYLFRGQKYLITENKTHQDICKQIKAEHPDFMKLLKEQNNDKSIKKISTKKLARKENAKKGKIGKAIIAVATTGALIVTGVVGYKHWKKYLGKKGEDKQLEQDSLSCMSVDELIEQLKEGHQKETFKKIDATQDNFNNNLALKIVKDEDKDARLHLKSEEVLALFVMANSDTYAKETFYEIFGKTDLMNKEDISDNYVEATRMLWAYYSRATEKSGMAELFQDDSNKKLVEDFENLIIKYNTSDNEGKINTKSEINEFFNELTDISLADPATKTNKEAVSYILTIGTSWAHANRIIDVETKNQLVAVNEVVTCDDLYKELENIEEYAKQQEQTENNKDEVVSKLPQALDKENIKTNNRDIDITYNGIVEENYDYEVEPEIENKKEEKKQEQITKEEAEEKFGKEEVKEKEQEAEEKVQEDNKEEEKAIEDYQNGYNDGYEKAYLHCATTGEKISVETTGSDKYKEGYQAGVNNGYNDGLIEYKAYLEAIKNIVVENPTQENKTTEEEVIIEETSLEPEEQEEVKVRVR